MNMSHWHVCELWMAIGVASLMLRWPSDAPLATPATWNPSR